ncbi:hypothetical protein KM176_07835 [Pseudooceanicola sp. CBS1P-1]|uniref:Uncharacterized protein n=1 Tax=Pseudooceanicola albus TaxID=2692189 RepID=A0A6L7G2F8_9RHOB|nr:MULTISPECIES: hypothetical protein [Pseudooceanicola]MBT9383762.1 hypothetical protein [Pseudooceanicola endophyticus]MXN17616.1 hypothetical protein [Pseudooceanicola albus]
MGTIRTSTYRPTLKETQQGRWYILFELYDDTGIPAVDRGDRQAAIMLPEGATEEQARALQSALHMKGAEFAFIE